MACPKTRAACLSGGAVKEDYVVSGSNMENPVMAAHIGIYAFVKAPCT